MLRDAFRAFLQTFSPEYRRFLIRSILIAVGLLIVLAIGCHYGLAYLVAIQWQWADVAFDIVAAVGLVVAAIFLVPPVTSLIAGLFVDDVAEQVERRDFPGEAVGHALPVGRSIWLSVKFFALMLGVNLIALLLLLVPGVNLVVFYVANGYLLGREYFQLAAMRYLSEDETTLLRRHHSVRIFMAGLIIAVVVSVPILNLVTPVFATIFMVRLHKRLAKSQPLPTP